jgi:hypothetical protein
MSSIIIKTSLVWMDSELDLKMRLLFSHLFLSPTWIHCFPGAPGLGFDTCFGPNLEFEIWAFSIFGNGPVRF